MECLNRNSLKQEVFNTIWLRFPLKVQLGTVLGILKLEQLQRVSDTQALKSKSFVFNLLRIGYTAALAASFSD